MWSPWIAPFFWTLEHCMLTTRLFGWKRRNNLGNVARKCILCNPFSFLHVEYEKDCYGWRPFFSHVWLKSKNLLIYTDQNFDLLDWPILLKKRLDSIQGSPCVLLLYATMALRLQLLGKWFANSMFCSYLIYYFK